MSFSESLSKIFVLSCICALLACCWCETKTTNSSDAAATASKSTLAGAETGRVETSVKLDGQESYPRRKSQPYPQSAQGYVEQAAVYENDPYKSYDEVYRGPDTGKDYYTGSGDKYDSQHSSNPSQSGYPDSFENYKQRFHHTSKGQQQKPKGPYSDESGYDSSQGTSYGGEEDYGREVAIPQEVHPDADYGQHQGYGSDEYSKDIPYGTKLSSKAYSPYSQEDGQKYVSYDQEKYPDSKPKYVAQVSKSFGKSQDSKSYDDSEYGKDYSYGEEQHTYGEQLGGEPTGQKYPQTQQHILYDELDVKHSDDDSGYASQKSKESPQNGFVTSYYYRGDKAYSSYPEKSHGKSYSSGGNEGGYFPATPKEASYITTGPKESSYAKVPIHAEKAEAAYYGGQKKSAILFDHKDHHSGYPGGKVSIFIKQLGHSAAGDGYGSKGGERHGYILLPVVPGKEGDALRIMKSAYGKKHDDTYHQDVTLSGYGQNSPVLVSELKPSSYKEAGLGYKPVYESGNYYSQKQIVVDGGKEPSYGLGYDVVLQDGGKSSHSAPININKGSDYAQDVYPYEVSNVYKHSEKPSSSYEGKGSSFSPLIPKSSHGIGSSGYTQGKYDSASKYKTEQYPSGYGKTNNYYSSQPAQYLSKGSTQSFRPSNHFSSKGTPATHQISSGYSSYGKSEEPKFQAHNSGYGSGYDPLSLLHGYQMPKSSAAAQRRIKSYAIILQKPQDIVQDAVYKSSSYPAESVKKSKLSSESKFKPIIGKSNLNSRRASLYHGVHSFSEPSRGSQKY